MRYGLPLLVSIRFQILFHSPSGVLFTFPSRYLFTIGQYEYLALDLSRPDFQPDFSCLVVLKKKLGNCMVFRDTGLSPSLVRHSRRVLLNSKHNSLWGYSRCLVSVISEGYCGSVNPQGNYVCCLAEHAWNGGPKRVIVPYREKPCNFLTFSWVRPDTRNLVGNQVD